MGKKITLAELQAETEKSFGDLEVDDVVFRSLLRLGDQRRKKAEVLVKQVNELQTKEKSGDSDLDDVDKITDVARKLLATTATDEKAAATMLKGLDDAELMTLLNMWNETTQPGEASSSSS